MHPHLQHESPHSKRSRIFSGVRPGALTWAVTFLLLAFVSGIYAFGGTEGEAGGLYGRIAMAGFTVLALMIFFIRRTS